VERGKELGDRTLIAFGGAAPLHAARLAEKLGIDTVIVPTGAGVGSAVGFLAAPVAYEVVRSRYMRLDQFDADAVNAVFADMRSEAQAVVEPGARSKALREVRTADMRYRGQGHEIAVSLPVGTYRANSAKQLADAFEAAYRGLFGRTIPDLGVEVLSWTLRLSDEPPAAKRCPPSPATRAAKAKERREIFDASQARFVSVPVYWRSELAPGEIVEGPAVIAEDETSTFITGAFTAQINGLGYITLNRRRAAASAKEVA